MGDFQPDNFAADTTGFDPNSNFVFAAAIYYGFVDVVAITRDDIARCEYDPLLNQWPLKIDALRHHDRIAAIGCIDALLDGRIIFGNADD